MKLSLSNITIIAVIFSLFLALTSYTNSSLLINILGSEYLTNYAYMCAGIFSIFHLFILSHSKKTKFVFAGSFLLLFLALVFLLAGIPGSKAMIVFSVIYLGLGTGLIYLMDLLVNEETPDGETGRTRGRYMAFQSLVWVIAPLVAGYIIDNLGGRMTLYSIALVLLGLLVALISTMKKVPNFTLPKKAPRPTSYDHHKRVSSFTNTLLLNCFYALMIIGMPVYLTNVAGWSWSQIGLTFTLMLLMFPLIQLPMGKYLDTHKREFRAISASSLLLIALSSIGILVAAPVSYLLTTILFITSRIGAATLEVASDTLFFDTVSEKHKGLVAWYRALVPISYTIVPLMSLLVSGYILKIYGLAVILILVAGYYAGSRLVKHLLLKK